MTEVLIVQRRLPHYREPFFQALRRVAQAREIRVRLVYGTPTDDEALKNDSGQLDWAAQVTCHYALGGRLCWQNVSHHLAGTDLVIVTSENRLLFNHWLQWRGTPFRLAFWGHGANFQGNADSWRERVKAFMSRRADWWFAYTDVSRGPLQRIGYPADRITVVNNAVDTQGLRQLRSQVRAQDIAALRERHGVVGNRVGVFVGSLYAEKRISMLLSAARLVRDRVDDFELLIVGAGPDQPLVESFVRDHAWCHYLGVQTGRDKAVALATGQVMLNPGLVGLGILDAFVCEIPMVTTDCGLHSPEIAYLDEGANAVMTDDTREAFADGVVRVLLDPAFADVLRSGCSRSAVQYTLENMATRFVEGIEACMSAPRLR